MVVIDDFKHLHLRFCILPGLHVHFFNEAIDRADNRNLFNNISLFYFLRVKFQQFQLGFEVSHLTGKREKIGLNLLKILTGTYLFFVQSFLSLVFFVSVLQLVPCIQIPGLQIQQIGMAQVSQYLPFINLFTLKTSIEVMFAPIIAVTEASFWGNTSSWPLATTTLENYVSTRYPPSSPTR